MGPTEKKLGDLLITDEETLHCYENEKKKNMKKFL